MALRVRVCRLDEIVPASSRLIGEGLVITPFVWALRQTPTLIPNGIEVDEIHWEPLSPLMYRQRNTEYVYDHKGSALRFPGYRVGSQDAERVVWGATYRMLERLLARIRDAPNTDDR